MASNIEQGQSVFDLGNDPMKTAREDADAAVAAWATIYQARQSFERLASTAPSAIATAYATLLATEGSSIQASAVVAYQQSAEDVNSFLISQCDLLYDVRDMANYKGWPPH
jgi:hypothetical protein